jgi:molybdopterin-guanine dinucleotide biosynthesis protein B
MHSVISLVGKSSSGKTTLLEKLIAELKRRGYKVAIVKHSHHADALDTAEKDTWRYRPSTRWTTWLSTGAWIIFLTRRRFPASSSGTMT